MTQSPPPLSLCDIFRYRALVQRSWSAPYWATVTSTWELIATLVYMGSEYLDNFQHLPANVSDDSFQSIVLHAEDTLLVVEVFFVSRGMKFWCLMDN